MFFLCVALVCTSLAVSAESTDDPTQTESSTTINEELIPCEATVEDNYVTGEIMVGIKSAYSVVNKVWTAADFPELSGITSIEDLTYADTEDAVAKFSAKEDFHQLLKISISNTTKSAVVVGIDALEQNEKLLFAEPNHLTSIENPVTTEDVGIALAEYYNYNYNYTDNVRYREYTNDPLLLQQTGIYLHNIDKVWNAFTTGSSNVTVGVIDTGIYNHIDMVANLMTGYNCVDAANETDYVDLHGHGTEVASIIGAKGNNGIGMSGVCQNITLYSLRVKDPSTGLSTDSAIARAFLKAETNNIPIINISLGGDGCASVLETAMEMYSGLIVCSAGNDSEQITAENPYYFPSSDLENLIAVGAMYSDGTIHKDSNYSTTYVDIMALGDNITTCLNTNGYEVGGQTSCATPFVTGVAALLLSYDNTLTPAEIKDYILNSAKPINTLTNYCVTGGCLDAYGAFLAMMGTRATCVKMLVYPYTNGERYTFEIPAISTCAKLTEIVIPTQAASNVSIDDIEVSFSSSKITIYMELLSPQSTSIPM